MNKGACLQNGVWFATFEVIYMQDFPVAYDLFDKYWQLLFGQSSKLILLHSKYFTLFINELLITSICLDTT